jgi:hypothetical protein
MIAAHSQVCLKDRRVPPLGRSRRLTLHAGTSFQSSGSLTSSATHNTSTPLQQSPPSAMSRLRASSSAFPSGLNARNQYLGLPLHHNTPAPAPRSHSFSTAFTAGYASAPLTAPVDFSLPRSPVESGQGRRGFSIPQLSAPMAPPQDFQSAYTSTLSPSRTQQSGREFNSQGSNTGDLAGLSRVQAVDQQKRPAGNHEETSYLRQSEHNVGQTRKRSFTMPGTFGST